MWKEQGVSINELQSLKKLRLGIVKLRTENGNGNALCYAVEKMKHLWSLKVRSAEENEILDWIRKLNNLAKLSLISSRLAGDPLPLLHVLNNLATLKMDKAYEGERLNWIPEA